MGKSQNNKIHNITKGIQTIYDYAAQRHASLSVKRIYNIIDRLIKLLKEADKLKEKMTYNEWRGIRTDISLTINFVLSNGNEQKIAAFASCLSPKSIEASEPQLKYENYPNKIESPVHIAQNQDNISLSEDYQTSDTLNVKHIQIENLNPPINEKEHMSSEISRYYTYIRRTTQDRKLEKDLISKLEDIQIKLLNFSTGLPILFDKGDHSDRIDAVVKQIQNELQNNIMDMDKKVKDYTDLLKLYGEFNKMQSDDTDLNREETRLMLETLEKILSNTDDNRNCRTTNKKDEIVTDNFLGQSNKQPYIVSKKHFTGTEDHKIKEKKAEIKTDSTSNTTSTNQIPIKDVKQYINSKRTHFFNEIVNKEDKNILFSENNVTLLNQNIQTKLAEVNKKPTISLSPFPIIPNEKIDYGNGNRREDQLVAIQNKDNLKNRKVEPEQQKEIVKKSLDSISIIPRKKLTDDVERKNLNEDKVVRDENLLSFKTWDVEEKPIEKIDDVSAEPMLDIPDKIDGIGETNLKENQVVTESNLSQINIRQVKTESLITVNKKLIHIKNEEADDEKKIFKEDKNGKELKVESNDENKNHREYQLVVIQNKDNLTNKQIEPEPQRETVKKSIDLKSNTLREKLDNEVENKIPEEDKFEKKEDLLNYKIGKVETKHIDKIGKLSTKSILDIPDKIDDTDYNTLKENQIVTGSNLCQIIASKTETESLIKYNKKVIHIKDKVGAEKEISRDTKNGKELRIESNSEADGKLIEPMLKKTIDDEKESHREDQLMKIQNEDNLNNRQIEPELQQSENNYEENQVTTEESVCIPKVSNENSIDLELSIEEKLDDDAEEGNLEEDKVKTKGLLSNEPMLNILGKIDSTDKNDFKEDQIVTESKLCQTNARQTETEPLKADNKNNLQEDKVIVEKTTDTNLKIGVITLHPNEVQEHNNKSTSTGEKATAETSLKDQLMIDDKEEKYTKEFNEISEIFRGLRKEIENFVGRESDNKFFEIDENCTRLVLRLDKLICERNSSTHEKKRELLKEIYKYADILYNKASE